MEGAGAGWEVNPYGEGGGTCSRELSALPLGLVTGGWVRGEMGAVWAGRVAEL